MISINTNYGSMHAAKSAGRSQQQMDVAMERLSSGLRINKAKDDAAGQGIATRLTAEIQGLTMAARNAADAQSLIDTAEAAHQEVTNMLLRMRENALHELTILYRPQNRVKYEGCQVLLSDVTGETGPMLL